MPAKPRVPSGPLPTYKPGAEKLPDPNKVIAKPPRLKPTATRNYGKGQTPLATGPTPWAFGGGSGYGK